MDQCSVAPNKNRKSEPSELARNGSLTKVAGDGQGVMRVKKKKDQQRTGKYSAALGVAIGI